MPRKRLPAKETLVRKNPTRSRRVKNNDEDQIPDVYREMLQEAAVSSTVQENLLGRAIKRRKISDQPEQPATPPVISPTHSLFSDQEGEDAVVRPRQVVYDDFGSSDESDAEFEDVELGPPVERNEDEAEAAEPKPLLIDLSKAPLSTPKKSIPRRKPITRAEREFRLDVHKWHVLCLLGYLRMRNRWCESDLVQAILKPLVPRKIISLLHVDEAKPQYQRLHSFNKGIEQTCAIWKSEWRTTIPGLRRAIWKEDVDASKEADEAEDPMDIEDFKMAAQTRSGSRDLGAQLFCCLLRALAVETRLVHSLQPLPFSGVAKGLTPEKPKSNLIYAPSPSYQEQSSSDPLASPSNPRWRLSEHASSTPPRRPRPSPKKRIHDSPFPVFWVEVFSPAAMIWVPLDPLVRQTINKPKTGFEPPASDPLNGMSYVIAFEEDGSAKDVTRRYAQFYNGKTRKQRVESTKGGEKWWGKTMNTFRKKIISDAYLLEDAELARRQAAEGMPRNVQDFKGHPIYVLERHLRRNEVIHPKREVGKVGTGTTKGSQGRLESVYRRNDVHVVRSAEQWYRRGRDVREGEAGLKRLPPKNTREVVEDEDEDVENGSAALYAEFQTDVYVPPPVVNGRIPKNAYGNLDVYVPSMIPAGAVHFQHPEAAKAAKLLGIHYVDAVTGFDFKGRQGTAVINGIVVAAEYRDAMVEVVEAMEYEKVKGEEERMRLTVLGLWKRFLTALRIRQRVDEEYKDDGVEEAEPSIGKEDDEGEEEDGSFVDEEEEEEEDDDDDDNGGGGFMPENAEPMGDGIQIPEMESSISLLPPPQEIIYREIVITESPHEVLLPPRTKQSMNRFQAKADVQDQDRDQDQDEGGGFLVDDADDLSDPERPSPGHGQSIDDVAGGGFIPEDDDEVAAGGFFPSYSENVADTEMRRVQLEDIPASLDLISEEMVKPSAHSPSRDPPQRSSPTDSESEPLTNAMPLPAQSASFAEHPKQRIDGQVPQPRSAWDSMSRSRSTSLLSHDPEDEDAEPEWLIDAEEA